MKFALVGYGKMGQTIERIALKRGHSISATITIDNKEVLDTLSPSNTDVVIEFSTPETAFYNVSKTIGKGLPTLSGTTGWNDKIPDIEKICSESGGTFFYASNYSLGVNLFFWLNKVLAEKMNAYPDYDIDIVESHHIHKLDKPSGTAITIAEQIIEQIDRKSSWVSERNDESSVLPITSIREGEVPGTHIVTYENEIEKFSIKHEAKSRDGFAMGAVLVAEWLFNKKGVFNMNDFLNL